MGALKLLSALTAALLLSASSLQGAFRPMEPVMPLSQVRSGMTGEMRTVFQGRKIQSFPVQILDIVSAKRPGSRGILIRASGDLIEQCGGMASGMSGSPVYVQGKLIGAFAFGWDYSDPMMGVVTPIEDMLSLFDFQERIPAPPKPVSLKPSPKKTEQEKADDPFEALYRRVMSRSAPKSVLSARGFSADACGDLSARLGCRVLPGAAPAPLKKASARSPLKPGASLSALLAWGDVSLEGTGTLTATDRQGRFIAFGHALKNLGAVALPVAESTVHAVIRGYETPFKLASSGTIRGLISQDRPAGVAGYLGRTAPAYAVSLSLEDCDSGRKSVRRFRTAPHENLFLSILPGALSSLAESTIGSEGGGTVWYDIEFSGAGIPDGWRWSDAVQADEGVLKKAAAAVSALVKKVVSNPFQDLGILGVKVTMAFSAERKTVRIEKVSLDDAPVKPGGEVAVTIRTRQWRAEEPEERRVLLKAPEDAEGELMVLVHAGSRAEDCSYAESLGDRTVDSFSACLREIGALERFSDVIVELTRPEEILEKDDEFAGERLERKIQEGSLKKLSFRAVVSGEASLPVLIDS